MKLNLWGLKLELHIIFMCHKVLLFFEFYVQPLKTVVTILRSLGTQKEAQAGLGLWAVVSQTPHARMAFLLRTPSGEEKTENSKGVWKLFSKISLCSWQMSSPEVIISQILKLCFLVHAVHTSTLSHLNHHCHPCWPPPDLFLTNSPVSAKHPKWLLTNAKFSDVMSHTRAAILAS